MQGGCSDTRAVEPEGPCCSRLLRIMRGEDQRVATALPPQKRAGEVQGIERLDRGRHGQRGTFEHDARQADAMDAPLGAAECRPGRDEGLPEGIDELHARAPEIGGVPRDDNEVM